MDVDAGKAVVAVLASVLQKLVSGNDKVRIDEMKIFSNDWRFFLNHHLTLTLSKYKTDK